MVGTPSVGDGSLESELTQARSALKRRRRREPSASCFWSHAFRMLTRQAGADEDTTPCSFRTSTRTLLGLPRSITSGFSISPKGVATDGCKKASPKNRPPSQSSSSNQTCPVCCADLEPLAMARCWEGFVGRCACVGRSRGLCCSGLLAACKRSICASMSSLPSSLSSRIWRS